MRIIILITILFNLFSCENKANNDFIKPYKKIIEFYNENSNYKKCTVNQEMDKIFKKKELTPIFRIENYYCYTIWLTENRDKNIFIYYTVFDHLSDIYETSKRFLIKNRTFNKVKSVNSDF